MKSLKLTIPGGCPAAGDIRTIAADAMKAQKLGVMGGRVHMSATFYLPLPGSMTGQRAESARRGGIVPQDGPDLGGLIETVTGACRAVVFKSLKQIAMMTAIKLYDDGRGERAAITFFDFDEEEKEAAGEAKKR